MDGAIEFDRSSLVTIGIASRLACEGYVAVENTVAGDRFYRALFRIKIEGVCVGVTLKVLENDVGDSTASTV